MSVSTTSVPKARWLAGCLIAVLSLVAGCGPSEVVVKGEFPPPTMEKLPLTIGVWYAPEFANHEFFDEATSRAETLLDGLRPGTAWGAPTGMAVFHGMRGEFDRAAEWAARAIDLRYPLLVALLRPLLGSTPVWPALARMMNLP